MGRGRDSARRALPLIVLLVVLVLGAGNAAGRAQTTTTVTVQVIGVGTVSSPSGFNCGNGGKTCFLVFATSSVTLTESPGAGWTFGGAGSWNGCDTANATTCDVTLGGTARTVTANFASTAPTSAGTFYVTYAGSGTVTAAANGTDQITCGSKSFTTDCAWTEVQGSTLTAVETPGDNSVFSGWSGDCASTNVACTIQLDNREDARAVFTSASAPAPSTLTVAVSGGGTVSGGGIACHGAGKCAAVEPPASAVTLQANPSDGYVFAGWSGDCTGITPTCTVSMDVDRNVTATFTAAISLSVTVSGSGAVSGGGGAINCGAGATICSATFAANATVTLVATTATGATFTGWTGACGGAATTCVVLMSQSKSVTATFTGGAAPAAGGMSFTLTVSVSGNGTVTGSGINCGGGATTCTSPGHAPSTSVTLTAAPATGATFAGWGGSCAGTATTCSVSMTASKSVSATFTTAGTPGTLTIDVGGKGTVSTTAGACAATGPSKTCIQHFKAGAPVTLVARPFAGQTFLGWSGACSGTKTTCTVQLTAAQTVTANFSSNTTGVGRGTSAALAPIGRPLVRRASTGWSVTLRFSTTVGGIATARGLRAGRTLARLALHVSAGKAAIGPIAVELDGYYTFEIRLAGRLLRMRACLGTCGRAPRGGPFTFTRETPAVTRTGDAWSVTLHAVSNQIYDGLVRAYRGSRLVVDQHFLGRATRVTLGPFLLGPGTYTLRLTALDPYGRVRTLTWIVSLAK